MTCIVTATNGWIAGVQVPAGTFDLPVAGQLGVSAEGYASNVVAVASGDTLILNPTGPTVLQGVGLVESWVLGFTVGLAAFGLVGTVRYMTRFLAGGARVADM